MSKYKKGSSIFEPFSISYWYEELKNKDKNAIFDFRFLVSLLERPKAVPYVAQKTEYRDIPGQVF